VIHSRCWRMNAKRPRQLHSTRLRITFASKPSSQRLRLHVPSQDEKDTTNIKNTPAHIQPHGTQSPTECAVTGRVLLVTAK